MTKQQFIEKLKLKLKGLSKNDVEERLSFYGEMIDDRIEAGLSEEDAISEVGSADEVASQIIEEMASSNIPEECEKNKKLLVWQIVLLVLGSPLWISLLLAGFAVIISVYAVIWAVTLTLWALELPFFIFSYISKYLLIGCKYATRGTLYLCNQGLALTKNLFQGENSKK